MDISAYTHNLPDGVPATLDDMTLHIGNVKIDLRTLLHEGVLDNKIKNTTLPADHARFPGVCLELPRSKTGYTGVVKNMEGKYLATYPKRKDLTTLHSTVSEAAIARALYLKKDEHPCDHEARESSRDRLKRLHDELEALASS